MLGLGRGARHKVLPAITLAVAFLPALFSVMFAAIVNDAGADDFATYGDYMFIIGTALALFAALIAPRRSVRTGAAGCWASTSPGRSTAPAICSQRGRPSSP